MADYPEFAQGPAKLANAVDLVHDASGITEPNLHRRINKDLSQYQADFILFSAEDDELFTPDGYSLLVPVYYGEGAEVEYTLSVHALSSYRTSSSINHDEESTPCEIP